MIDLREGDCLTELRNLDADSVSACVTDPPYGLSAAPDPVEVLTRWLAGDDFQHRGGGFMGKTWDSFVPGPSVWREVHRVLKPGGYLLAFGGTRTADLLAVAIRLAGFEIRDTIAWMFGSGFPKSLDVSKAIDKAAGVEREVVGVKPGHEDFLHRTDAHAAGGRSDGWDRPWRDDPEAIERSHMATAPATPEAERWQGWGTALKPAFEPIVVARKPFRGTVVANVLKHGTGAINVDGCRIGFASDGDETEAKAKNRHEDFGTGARENQIFGKDERTRAEQGNYDASGRWPANVMLGHSEDCVLVGEREVASDGHYPQARPGGVEVGTVGHTGQEGLEERHTRGETVEVWDCHHGCPIRLLDEQSGVGKDGVASGRNRGFPKDGLVGGYGSDYDGDPQGYGGAGGASRFFKTVASGPEDTFLPPCEGDAPARAAQASSDPDEHLTNTAQSDVATSRSREDTPPASHSLEPSTSGTPTESSGRSESDTPPIPNTGSASSPASPREKPSLTRSRARTAEPSELTDTTTTTTSPSKSAGDADAATYGDTPTNTALGEADSLPILHGAERFRYCAKTSRAERNAGLDGFEERTVSIGDERSSGGMHERYGDENGSGRSAAARNHHPTVKPVAVMRWLVRLVTPPGGTVLDPFMGSGSTGIACVLEGFDFVGVELDGEEYLPIARARIAFWEQHGEDALRIVAEREQAEQRRVAVAESGQLDLLG